MQEPATVDAISFLATVILLQSSPPKQCRGDWLYKKEWRLLAIKSKGEKWSGDGSVQASTGAATEATGRRIKKERKKERKKEKENKEKRHGSGLSLATHEERAAAEHPNHTSLSSLHFSALN